MPRPPVRIGILGTGFGAIHAEAFRRDARCQVTAVWSRSQAHAEAAAARWGARPFTDFRELLAAGLCDALSIATPPALQAEIGMAALGQGLPVCFEKPLAHSLDAAEQLARLAAAKAVTTAMSFEFPELAVWREAKRRLDAGEIGRPLQVSVRWHVETYANKLRKDVWKTRPQEGGGTMNMFSSHTFHYLEWLLGPMQRLYAKIQRSPGDHRTGDTINHLALEGAESMPIVASIATNVFGGSGHVVEIFGEDGTLRLQNSGADYTRGFILELARRPDAELHSIVSEAASGDLKEDEDGRIAPMARIVRRFVDSLTGGPPCSPDVRAGLRVQQLMAAAQRSQASGRSIDLSELAPAPPPQPQEGSPR